MNTSGCDRLYPIAEMHYGIIHPGKWQNPSESSASAGTWTELTYLGWHIYQNNTTGNYLEWDIPADHNRIHLLTCHAGNSGTTSLSLNGTTSGLDITTVNHSTGNLIQESVITTKATGGKFRVSISSEGLSCGIVGIHSFNTNAAGSPYASDDGMAEGHDFVDQCVFRDNSYSRLHYETPIDASPIWKANTTEFTLNWKEASQADYRWTGYGAHYGGTGNADFTPTMDAALFVNGISAGKMWDTDQISLGKLYSGNSITAIVEGYGDYNQNDIQDPEDILNLRITQDFTATGIGITNQLKWSGTWSIQEGPYVPSVNLSDNVSGYVQFPPDETLVSIGSNFSDKYANSLSVFLYDIDCSIVVSSSGTVEKIFEKSLSDKKIYFDIDKSVLAGAASPAAGDTWAISANIRFQSWEKQSPQVGSILAWGDNSHGECDLPSPNAHFIGVASGKWHSVGLKADGKIIAWGDNSFGQCDIPDSNDIYTEISATMHHSLALKMNGSIIAWGDNSEGQCDIPLPNENFRSIDAGSNFSLGLKENGTVVGWGNNDYGQCTAPSPNTGFIMIAAGYYHALGIQQDGSIAAWGSNAFGQCNIPEPNADFIAVSVGSWHSLGLKKDGTIVAWGDNRLRQCNIPSPNADFIAVDARPWGGMALRQDGSLVFWGSIGATQPPYPNSNFGVISAGASHNLVITGTCLYSLAGDVNNDCRFDITDWAAIANNWLMDCHTFPYAQNCIPK